MNSVTVNTEVRYTQPAKLDKEKFNSIFLLSIGTFLKYFDLMLYIHLAVLLNDLFFPQSNPTTAFLLSTTAFVMTYILRPVGGYIIGKIGDFIGRPSTVMITTFIMAGACLRIATLKTYEEIGITATITIIICRMAQGISSMGEFMGATIYLSETLKSPYKYVASSFIRIGTDIGGTAALIVAYWTLSSSTFNWRTAFFMGTIIALVGGVARTKLRETPEFADHKLRLKKKAEKDAKYFKRVEVKEIPEKIDKKAVLGLFFTGFTTSASVYFTYIFLSNFAKKVLEMSSNEITSHNLKISISSVFFTGIIAYLCKKYHPVNIAKINIYTSIITGFLVAPYLLNHISSNDLWLLFFLQFATFLVSTTMIIIESAWVKHFPIKNRFTIMATTYGVANVLSNVTVAYTLIPLTNLLGYYSIWIIYIPIIIGFLWGINYLQKLEIKSGTYYNYPYEKPLFKDTALRKEYFTYDLPSKYDKFRKECEYSTNFINEIKELSEVINPTINISLIKKAIIYAKKWHHGQERGTGGPFYTHPLEVAIKVARKYLKTDVIVAAILHDVVEDSDCTVEVIKAEFNSRIAEIVDRLTKVRDVVDGSQIKLTFQETIDRLSEYDDYEATFIKLFDRIHNLETIEGLKPVKQEKMARETNNFLVEVVAKIADKLGINEKIQIEEELFEISSDVLRKNSA